MPNNLPGNDNYAAALPPQEEPPEEKIDEAQRQLAAAAESKSGKVLLDHMKKNVDNQLNVLKYTNFTEMDPIMALGMVLSAQNTLAIFEDVLNSVEFSKQAIEDAKKR